MFDAKNCPFCLKKLSLRHFCRECRENLSIRILRTKFWSSQLVRTPRKLCKPAWRWKNLGVFCCQNIYSKQIIHKLFDLDAGFWHKWFVELLIFVWSSINVALILFSLTHQKLMWSFTHQKLIARQMWFPSLCSALTLKRDNAEWVSSDFCVMF